MMESEGIEINYTNSGFVIINGKCVIPDNCIKIDDKEFVSLECLKEVIIPKSVTEIGSFAFCGCRSLEEIVIPNSVEVLGTGAFSSCSSLKQVILPKGVTEIGSFAFCGCSSLEEIVIPNSVTKIEEGVFGGCHSLREIVINYEDYSKLKNIVNQMCVKDKWNYNLLLGSSVKLNKINLTFVGKELTGLQKLVILNKVKDFGEIKFTTIDYSDEIDKCDDWVKNEELFFNNEINSLLDDIDNIINNLSDDVGDAIKKKVSLLIEEYNKNIIEYNKYIDKDESDNLELGMLDPEVVLISKLTSLKVSLSDYNNLINNLSKISEYENIIDSKVDNMPDNLNNIEDILKSIVYLVSKLDDKKKEEIYNRVKNYLDFAKKHYQNNFDTLLDKNSTLLVLDFDSPLKQLQINLLNLLDDVILYSKKVSCYLELLDVLKSKEVDKYIDDKDIKNMIISIRYLISCINYIPNRDKLNNLFDSIINKYILIIDKKLDIVSSINSNDYNKIEVDIRKELIPLLNLLKLYSCLDNIYIELSNSKEILVKREVKEVDEDKLIESLFIDINNCLINDTLLSNDKKENEIEKLLNIIDKWLDEMDSMNSCDDKNILLQDIFKDIYKIKINLDLLFLKKSKLVKKRKIDLGK